MNNPGANRNLSSEREVLRCCIIVQRVEKELQNKTDKRIDAKEHGQTDIGEGRIEGQVIDTTAGNITNILEDDGTMTRRVEKGPVIKSAKLPKDIKSMKRLQDVRNKKKLEARRQDKDNDKEI